MQYDYDFHLHHWLVEASQMLREFESFHCNRKVHNVSWYGKLSFFPGPHLNSRKRVFDCSQKLSWESRKLLFLYLLFEKVSGHMSSKVEVMKFLQYIMT